MLLLLIFFSRHSRGVPLGGNGSLEQRVGRLQVLLELRQHRHGLDTVEERYVRQTVILAHACVCVWVWCVPHVYVRLCDEFEVTHLKHGLGEKGVHCDEAKGIDGVLLVDAVQRDEGGRDCESRACSMVA